MIREYKTPKVKLRDCDIRAAVLRTLVAPIVGHEPSRVIQEFGLATGAIRVDIAVANGRLHGFEIKSEADTLQRLTAQAEAYNRVFDTVTIICGRNHIDAVLDAMPAWWGVAIAGGPRNDVSFEFVRAAGENRGVNATALLQLLWRDELIQLLENRGVRCSALPKRKLWELAAVGIELDEIKTFVKNTLKKRTDWRPDSPPA